jgi:uncharacterized protein
MRDTTCVAVVIALLLWSGPPLAGAEAPLVEAARAGRHDMVRALVAGGADVNQRAGDGTTALHWSVLNGDAALVDLLLAAGADVSAANRHGVTPLALAATNGSGPLVERLLGAGADPNAANADGETALMRAARTGRPEPVAALLAHGADVNAVERPFGETALMWAAAENHPEGVRLLAARGADLDRQSRALEFPPVRVDFATMVSTALPRGGMSALMLAARQGAAEAAAALLEAGANPDLTDPDGTSALVLAVINVHYDTAAVLVRGGANPDVADTTGMTALYAAVDMHTMDPLINRPPPVASSELDAVGLAGLLLEHGADPDARLRAPLLQRQHNTGNTLFGEGATALMRAARAGDVPMVRVLLEGGADPSLAAASGATALMFAVGLGGTPRGLDGERRMLEAATLCLDHGAAIDAADANGQTALHVAVGRSDALVRLLASRGARLDLTDRFGRTPLDVALGVPAGGGRGGRGGGGGPAPPRERTADLLRELMAEASPRP